MSTIVCKFGGSSVSDAGMFQRVLHIIQNSPERRYIVLSAPGKRFKADAKITDLFYQAYANAAQGDNSILSEIFKRYAQLRDAVAPHFDLEAEFREISSKLNTSPDYAASRGEYLCARLFAFFASLPFVDAAELIHFLPSGEVDLERSRRNVQNKLAPLPCAVIPGFYGTDANGRIKTFSRGGSDVSGALLSALLHVDLYENWTDVDGLYTADPNIVCDAAHNHQVSFAQMESIARAGAQLLHPDAFNPLVGTGIDILLKNSFLPNGAGTRISEACHANVRCVTGKRRCTLPFANIEKRNENMLAFHSLSEISVFGYTQDQLPAMLAAVNPIHIIHMQDHMRLIVAESEYEAGIRALHSILMERENPDSMQ